MVCLLSPVPDRFICEVGLGYVGERAASPKVFVFTLGHRTSSLDYRILHQCIVGQPHAVDVGTSRLPPGPILSLCPGTSSPSCQFDCFIACNSCIRGGSELQGRDHSLRIRPETVSPPCAEQWTVMPGGIFFQRRQFSVALLGALMM